MTHPTTLPRDGLEQAYRKLEDENESLREKLEELTGKLAAYRELDDDMERKTGMDVTAMPAAIEALQLRVARLVKALELVKQRCLYAEDDGVIGISEDVHIDSQLFDSICEALSATPQDDQAWLRENDAKVTELICAAIKAEDDRLAGEDYMMDSNDCINVIREFSELRSQSKGEEA